MSRVYILIAGILIGAAFIGTGLNRVEWMFLLIPAAGSLIVATLLWLDEEEK